MACIHLAGDLVQVWTLVQKHLVFQYRRPVLWHVFSEQPDLILKEEPSIPYVIPRLNSEAKISCSVASCSCTCTLRELLCTPVAIDYEVRGQKGTLQTIHGSVFRHLISPNSGLSLPCPHCSASIPMESANELTAANHFHLRTPYDDDAGAKEPIRLSFFLQNVLRPHLLGHSRTRLGETKITNPPCRAFILHSKQNYPVQYTLRFDSNQWSKLCRVTCPRCQDDVEFPRAIEEDALETLLIRHTQCPIRSKEEAAAGGMVTKTRRKRKAQHLLF